MSIKTTDAKGRLGLGTNFANRVFIIEIVDDEIHATPARVLPEREAWLFSNPVARDRLLKGLEQARAGQFSKNPPDLEEAAKLAEQIED